MNKNSNYIPTLDGWRAISIFAVIIYHSSFYFFYSDGIQPNEIAHNIFKLGAFGVHIFFGISGFLITSRMIKEVELFNDFNIKEFYIRRIFRILPIFLTYVFFIFLISSFQLINIPNEEIISSLFFYRNYVEFDTWYLGHFWSLSFEEHYYIFWPLLFSLAPKRHLKSILLFLIFIIVVWRLIEYRYSILSPFLSPSISPRSRTDLFLDYILWGSFSACLYRDEKIKKYMKKFLQPWLWPLLVVIFVLIYFIRVPQVDFFRAVIIQLCLLSTILNSDSSWTKVFELNIVSWIGRLSYSLYIWQQFFMVRKDFIINKIEYFQILPLNLIALFIVAYLSHRFIEKPMINLGKKYVKRVY